MKDKFHAYEYTKQQLKDFFQKERIDDAVLGYYDAVLSDNIANYSSTYFNTSGFVVHSLELVLWCFLHTDTFDDAVKSIISFGGDTDTNACVLGGLAGLHYGYEAIPKDRLDVIVKKDLIQDSIEKYLFSLA